MVSLKEKVISMNPGLWENFERCTSEFKKVEENDGNKSMSVFKVNNLGVGNIESYMIYMIFVKLKDFPCDWKPMEKTLFSISFKFENCFCFFSMEKFGLKFGVNENDFEIIKRLFGKLNSAIKITNQLLQPVFIESINNGSFTMENRSSMLYERYIYFRSKVDEINKTYANNFDAEDPELFLGNYTRKIKREKEVIFNTQAMLDSYFSFQEHLLALLIPFSEVNKERSEISELINEQWSTKFSQILNVTKDAKMMKNYNQLKRIKEIRNKYAHGGFKKKNGSLLTHIEDMGAIPIELSQSKNIKDFSFILIDDVNYTEICSIIDEFEEYINNSEWSRPIKIIESGLDINYDLNSISQYSNAITSKEELESFIEMSIHFADRNANMDW